MKVIKREDRNLKSIELREKYISEAVSCCPCCGEEKDVYTYYCEGNPLFYKGIQIGFPEISTKRIRRKGKFFSEPVEMEQLSLACWSCGAQWKSEWYPSIDTRWLVD